RQRRRGGPARNPGWRRGKGRREVGGRPAPRRGRGGRQERVGSGQGGGGRRTAGDAQHHPLGGRKGVLPGGYPPGSEEETVPAGSGRHPLGDLLRAPCGGAQPEGRRHRLAEGGQAAGLLRPGAASGVSGSRSPPVATGGLGGGSEPERGGSGTNSHL